MKSKAIRIFFIISCVILIAIIVIYSNFALDTPRTPKVSFESGYYQEDIMVEITPDRDCTVYYTLDGSIPTEDSTVYSSPIVIKDRSSEADLLSKVGSVVRGGLKASDNGVKKGTVLKAICVNRFGEKSEVLTRSYFVGKDFFADEEALTVSITAQYDDLFGDEGIYVCGKEYDEWLDNGMSGDEPEPNYIGNGEIECFVEMLEGNNTFMSQKAGLQIQGGSSRDVINKNFTLVSRFEYSGSETFDEILYEDEGVKTHSVMFKPDVTNPLMKDLFFDRDVSFQEGRACDVYLNGDFMYRTYMLERFDKNYFYQHFGAKDPVIIKNAELNHGEEDDDDNYLSFYYWVNNTDFSSDDNFAQLCGRMDVQSYIDNVCIQAIIANWDYEENGKNYMCWRTNTDERNEYCDGKWRFMIYDPDILVHTKDSMGVEPYELNTFTSGGTYIDYSLNETSFYKAFRQNDSFNKMFVDSYMDILENDFSKENIDKVIEKYDLSGTWLEEFLQKRPDFAEKYLREEFDIE